MLVRSFELLLSSHLFFFWQPGGSIPFVLTRRSLHIQNHEIEMMTHNHTMLELFFPLAFFSRSNNNVLTMFRVASRIREEEKKKTEKIKTTDAHPT